MTPVSRPVAAEVAAAQRALGTAGPLSNAGPAPGSATWAAPDVDEILDEVLAANRVEIVGILPSECASRLVQLKGLRLAAGQDVIHPLAVRYFTPSRQKITRYRQPGVLGSLVQRWIAGVNGLRNWLSSSNSGVLPSSLTISEFDDIYLDCLICICRGDSYSVVVISQLPSLVPSQETDQVPVPSLVIARMSQDQVHAIRRYVEILAAQSTPLIQLEILCQANPAGAQAPRFGDEFVPVISQLATYGSARPSGSVMPASAVVVCVSTARGPAVVLKSRTARNSRDAFGKLSLISERILVEDLTDLLTSPLPADNVRALDDIWIRAGQPPVFTIPESGFRGAAQRELFESCGLDVPNDRLELRGSCVIEYGAEAFCLGFQIFRLALSRSPAFDELVHVRSWNPDLEVIPLADLYSPENKPRLNRLLADREGWLRNAVISPPQADGSFHA